MILQRLCNYFAACVQLDEIIHREGMDMSFVLRRQGPVECPVSFRIRGSSGGKRTKEHRHGLAESGPGPGCRPRSA